MHESIDTLLPDLAHAVYSTRPHTASSVKQACARFVAAAGQDACLSVILICFGGVTASFNDQRRLTLSIGAFIILRH